MGPPISRSRNGAFSLVEILVVISIVSVLVALLAPALKAARESARAMRCMQNMRQIGHLLQEWGADHGGALMRSQVPCDGDPSALRVWLEELVDLKYLPFESPGSLPCKKPELYTSMLRVAFCPDWEPSLYSLTKEPPYGPISGFHLNAHDTYHFGINTFFQDCWGETPPLLQHMPAGSVADPARTLWLADTCWYVADRPFPSGADWLRFRHRDGANVFFVDGHTEHLTRDRFGTQGGDYPWMRGALH